MPLKRLHRSTVLTAFAFLSTVVLTPSLLQTCAAAEPPHASEPANYKDARIGMAVMTMQMAVGAPSSLQAQFESKIRAELNKRKRLRLVAREVLPQAIQEIRLSDDGLINPKQRQELGHVNAVDYLIFPRLTKYEQHDSLYSLSIGLKIVSVKTNVESFVELTGSFTATQATQASANHKKKKGLAGLFDTSGGTAGTTPAEAEEALLNDAISGAGKKVLSSLNLQDGVAEDRYAIIDVNRQENTFMIDAGKSSGIVDGMELKIFTVANITLSSGRSYEKKNLIGVARVIHAEDDVAQLQIGTVKQEGGFLNKHPVWHLDTEKMAQVTEKCVATLNNDEEK